MIYELYEIKIKNASKMKNLFTLTNMHSIFLSRQSLIHCHYEPFFQIGTLFFLLAILCFFLQKSGEIHGGIGPSLLKEIRLRRPDFLI